MKLYDCKVRLHANPQDEVRRRKVTAAEIRVLRQMHGDDAVVEIKETGEATARSVEQERDRLARLYTEPVVTKLFGAPVVKVDTDLSAEFKSPLDDLPLATRTPVEKPVAKPAEKTGTDSSLFE